MGAEDDSTFSDLSIWTGFDGELNDDQIVEAENTRPDDQPRSRTLDHFRYVMRKVDREEIDGMSWLNLNIYHRYIIAKKT